MNGLNGLGHHQPQEHFHAMRYMVKHHNPQSSGTSLLGISLAPRDPRLS